MSLTDTITNDTKDALRSRNRSRTGTLRMLNAALKNESIDKGRSLSEEEERAVLRRQLKQREESAEAYQKAGREEQAGAESAEAEIIRGYLPAPPSAAELEKAVEQAIEETGATGMKDMGSAMNRAREIAGDRAEGRELAALVRSRLQ